MELYWVAIIVFVLLVPLVIKISQMPAENFFKRRRRVVPAPVKVMDWEAISKRWEKNNALLNNEIDTLKKERKSLSDKLEDQQKIIAEQLEQLAREKAWREKENQVVEKVKNFDHELKEDLRKAQNQLNDEHGLKLKVDIELQEAKITMSKLKEEVRALTVKLMAIEKEADAAKKELKELRWTNADLKKQKEDIQWVAKSDYDDAVLKLKKVESELGRLTRDQKNQRDAWPAGPVASAPKASHAPEIAPPVASPALNPEPQAPVEEAAANEAVSLPSTPAKNIPQENPQPQAEVVEKPVEVTPPAAPEAQAAPVDVVPVNVEPQVTPVEAAPSATQPEQTASLEVPLSVTPEAESPVVETPPAVSAEDTTLKISVAQTEAVEGTQKADSQGQAGPSEDDQKKNPGPQAG